MTVIDCEFISKSFFLSNIFFKSRKKNVDGNRQVSSLGKINGKILVYNIFLMFSFAVKGISKNTKTLKRKVPKIYPSDDLI